MSLSQYSLYGKENISARLLSEVPSSDFWQTIFCSIYEHILLIAERKHLESITKKVDYINE